MLIIFIFPATKCYDRLLAKSNILGGVSGYVPSQEPSGPISVGKCKQHIKISTRQDEFLIVPTRRWLARQQTNIRKHTQSSRKSACTLELFACFLAIQLGFTQHWLRVVNVN